jgi:hypothetical protein
MAAICLGALSGVAGPHEKTDRSSAAKTLAELASGDNSLDDGAPPAFFAPHPTVIKVQILDQTLEIVADRFRGLGTSPKAQERFDRLREVLEAIERDTRQDGRVLPLFR